MHSPEPTAFRTCQRESQIPPQRPGDQRCKERRDHGQHAQQSNDLERESDVGGNGARQRRAHCRRSDHARVSRSRARTMSSLPRTNGTDRPRPNLKAAEIRSLASPFVFQDEPSRASASRRLRKWPCACSGSRSTPSCKRQASSTVGQRSCDPTASAIAPGRSRSTSADRQPSRTSASAGRNATTSRRNTTSADLARTDDLAIRFETDASDDTRDVEDVDGMNRQHAPVAGAPSLGKHDARKAMAASTRWARRGRRELRVLKRRPDERIRPRWQSRLVSACA